MTPEFVQRHSAPVPRYTSYPTANHFSPAVTASDAARWLAELPEGSALSLYLHIPYCRELCHYCGCSTKAVRRYAPVQNYVEVLLAEIETVAALVPREHRVAHIHWGGGSPDILTSGDIVRLGRAFRDRFTISAGAEIAVEIDPRLLTVEQADSFAEIGVNRVSIGVQDFDPEVQKAIGRIQSVETTRNAVELFRGRGISAINVDLVYGLPHQTLDKVGRTIDEVIGLAPSRVAVFGYAHLPERLKHQRLIDGSALPDAYQRFLQQQEIGSRLAAAGYVPLGIDHFARPDDALATGPIARNFQGYTTDRADALIGLGASAISRLPQGYAQNAVAVEEYGRRIASGALATVRGHEMRGSDALRAYVIERLMCDFSVSWCEVADRFGGDAAALIAEAGHVACAAAREIVEMSGVGFAITPEGRPFVRSVCAAFDPYLSAHVEKRRHAPSI